jgi:alkanesulfonate monooxygenase SsuD/methylene tetrahydromethanopterin reductase-like flavin-dependent oxidoreductase (luciferase family)
VQRPTPPITIGGSGPTRTLRAVARHAQAWNAITRSPAEWQGHHEVLVERCAEIGRDPAEILSSVNARAPKDGSAKDWAAQVADTAHSYAEVGVGLLVVNLPNPYDPADLEPLADALRPLAG